jgi:hypothetical protein
MPRSGLLEDVSSLVLKSHDVTLLKLQQQQQHEALFWNSLEEMFCSSFCLKIFVTVFPKVDIASEVIVFSDA